MCGGHQRSRPAADKGAEVSGGVRIGGISRGRFLRLAGAGAAGLALAGTGARAAQGQERQALEQTFERAGERFGVPQELLKAMGYANTRWAMPPADANVFEKGSPHAQGVYGVMALRQNPSGNTLGLASDLTDLSEATLKQDRFANVVGGAAVLSRIVGPESPATLDGWREAVGEYGGGDLYVEEVYHWLGEGAETRLSDGDRVNLAGQDVAQPRFTEARAGGVDYPKATWYGAADNNYTNANRERRLNISKVVIHIAEGYYAGTINWINTESSDVSAHYVVRSRDGAVGQCVRNEDIAWHAGNWSYNQHSIGIEHEGFARNPDWYTEKMLRGSARLTAWCCKRHKIPVNRRHIVGHREVPGVSKTCPGGPWSWERYMNFVRRYRAQI